MQLESLAKKHGSNKASSYFEWCNFYEFHSQHIHSRKDQDILEIGSFKGESLRMWKEFFPHANFASVDIVTTKEVANIEGTKCYQGCQSSIEIRDRVKSDFPSGFDLIIDDASHQNELTIKTFEIYWELLKDGGVFIIEDLHCSYSWCTSNSKEDANNVKTPLGYLRHLIKDINYNYHFLGVEKSFPIYRRNRNLLKQDMLLKHIELPRLTDIGFISFGNGICAIHKESLK